MSIYRNVKQKYHPGLTAGCPECMAKMTTQDPGFAQRFSKQSTQKRKTKFNKRIEGQSETSE